MKKIISLVLVVAMIATAAVAFTGCGGNGKKEGTFRVFGYATDSMKADVYEKYHAKWEANCEYDIEWMTGDIGMIMASGGYPDIIAKTQFQNVDVARYADEGILIPLEEYISEENTPNIWKMFQDFPTTKAIATSPDGHIYALPSYGGNKGQYVETCWWINRAWLDKLGLKAPTNLDELYEVLKAFKTKDPNGNGKADEIPMTFQNDGAYSYPETLLSCWGISTKFGMYDGYLNVQKGKVNFTPMMDEWKLMINYYAKLYKEGLLDREIFTQTSAIYSSKLKADTPIVGLTFNKENVFQPNEDQYEVILPLKASADSKIKPVLHVHPGSMGTRNAAHVTSACKDPAAAMRWLDTFYDKEATLQNWYGEAGDGAKDTFTKEGNLYKWKDPSALGYDSVADMYAKNTTYGPHMLGYLNLELAEDGGDVGVLVEDGEAFSSYREVYEMHEPYLDPETWPRPYYSPEDSNELSTIQTDIHAYVEEKKAEWILGRSNVDADWDAYIKRMKALGADRYLEINQDAYDVFAESLKDIK